MKRRKIAIIGAPGSGKTTIASGLFYHLKMLQKKTEIVRELIKDKVYQQAKFNEPGFDVANTLEQKELETMIASAPDLEFLICEAPLCNGYFYSFFYKKEEEWPILKKIAKNHINDYDMIVFVEHSKSSQHYETFGRKESQSDSLLIEKLIEREIKNLGYKGNTLKVTQNTNIMSILITILNPESYLLEKESSKRQTKK